MPTATSFCSSSSGWCYFATTTAATFSAASTACANNGRHLLTVDSLAEQQELEAAAIISAASDVWLGLSYTGAGWVWRNGTVLQTLAVPSNSGPYAHW